MEEFHGECFWERGMSLGMFGGGCYAEVSV